jgi:chemotaxis regulatin CheY-phosphate phosphatase CheZ
MKQSELSSVDLLSKYVNLQDELSSLAGFIDETRNALGGVQEKLPTASDALAGVTQATEKATHNILQLVEEVMERDAEMEDAFATLASAATTDEAKEAVEVLRSSADERMMKLTEMMTELSFQDLTCQAIQKISKTILEVEKRVIALIDADDEQRPSKAAPDEYSGLSRLEESFSGKNKQQLIDELLNGR